MYNLIENECTMVTSMTYELNTWTNAPNLIKNNPWRERACNRGNRPNMIQLIHLKLV
jgi:hypothetical protein